MQHHTLNSQTTTPPATLLIPEQLLTQPWVDPLVAEFHRARNVLYAHLVERLGGDTTLADVFMDRLHYLCELLGTTTDDWLIIKQRLTLYLGANLKRKKLMTKRRSDRKFYHNHTEHLIIDYWASLTGVRPTIRPEHFCLPDTPKKKQYQSIRDHNARASAALLERNKKKQNDMTTKATKKKLR